MAQYNFWTSQGFIQTSTITRYNTNGNGTSAITTNFSELHKYPLPNTTIYSSSNNGTYTKLFGFVRGTDTFEFQYMLFDEYGNGSGIVGSRVRLLKNGTVLNAIQGRIPVGSYSDACRSPYPTHFFICQPLSTSTYSTNVTSTIYEYNTSTININGTNTTTNGKGGFCIGFCNNNLTINNTYQNNYNPSSNNIRCLLSLVKLNNTTGLTNLSEYPTLLEFICGKNVKYVGDDDISEPGGGFGTGDSSTDDNPIPDTSDTTDFEATNIIMNGSGLFTTHIMDTTSITQLVSKLWDTSISAALERLLGSKPLDVIISLKRLPITISSSAMRNIYLGTSDTEINTPIVTNQYVTVNCGTLYPKEYWGNALDYSPSTKFYLYMPFVGIKSINPDWFQNKEITVKYIIDVLSGDFTCFLQQGETTDTIHQNVVATYTGKCAMQYPLSASDYSGMFIAGMSVIKGGAAGAVIGGSAGAVLGAATSAANTITMKPTYDMTGSYNANMGFCGVMKPYIIIERPIQSLPDKIENYVGFPSNIVSTLSSLTGFTKVQDINLSVNCTLDEKNEIESLLKRGVII